VTFSFHCFPKTPFRSVKNHLGEYLLIFGDAWEKVSSGPELYSLDASMLPGSCCALSFSKLFALDQSLHCTYSCSDSKQVSFINLAWTMGRSVADLSKCTYINLMVEKIVCLFFFFYTVTGFTVPGLSIY